MRLACLHVQPVIARRDPLLDARRKSGIALPHA